MTNLLSEPRKKEKKNLSTIAHNGAKISSEEGQCSVLITELATLNTKGGYRMMFHIEATGKTCSDCGRCSTSTLRQNSLMGFSRVCVIQEL